ncbi:MAG: dihydroorotate dehydrogenase [Planctomycetota bacterium]|jgi:dihydroorotate dehydrogenase (NAD+) catalytic subunit|nr:dihydroorotate dehydrogenase [Planctomycetota bacterium]
MAEARRPESDRLKTRVGKLELANPILPASGIFGDGGEYRDFYDPAKLGGVVSKSVTLEPTRGNPPPRIAETPAGMLNSIGLQNGGLEHFLAQILPPLRAAARRVIVSVAGKTADEYETLVRRLAAAPVDALEINVSCPNVKEGGIAFGVSARAVEQLTRRLRRAAGGMPLWLKLTPNVADIGEIARAAEAAGADALVVANTFLGMAVDVERRRPVLANVTGGLSGPAIHPLALRALWQARRAVSRPLVAAGGTAGLREVLAFLITGASAVEVGSMNLVDPGLAGRLVDELEVWLREHDATLAEIIGTLRT